MKSINDVYGPLMNMRIAQKFVDVTNQTIELLKLRRTELLATEDGIHHPMARDVIEDLSFHIRLNNQYREYIKGNS